MKIIGKTVGYVAVSFVALLLALTLFLFVSNKTNPDSVPSIFGYKMMTVLSGSMRPVFEPGDMLIAKDVDPTEIKKGDIITFIQEEKYVTHRVIEIHADEGSFTTKGDFNDSADPNKILAENVVATYITHIPYLGMILQELSGIYGFLLLIVLPIMILVIGELNDSRKRKLKRAKRKPPENISF